MHTCVAVCCSVLQCVRVCMCACVGRESTTCVKWQNMFLSSSGGSASHGERDRFLGSFCASFVIFQGQSSIVVPHICSVLRCVAVCCIMLQCAGACHIYSGPTYIVVIIYVVVAIYEGPLCTTATHYKSCIMVTVQEGPLCMTAIHCKSYICRGFG